MKFYFVPYHIVKDKIQETIENNKAEFKKHYGDVDVDWLHFDQLSLLGLVYVAIAVKKDVIGFAAFVINENATHKEKEAENVAFYFNKEYRGKHFSQLLDYSKDEFSKMGVSKITATIKSNVLARALRVNNFKKEYEIWSVNCV